MPLYRSLGLKMDNDWVNDWVKWEFSQLKASYWCMMWDYLHLTALDWARHDARRCQSQSESKCSHEVKQE